MEGKMRAQVFYEAEKMKLERIDIPKVMDDEVLLRVKACGICGSDMSYYFGHSPLGTKDGKGPLVLGHEFCGDVVEVGRIPASKGLFKPGDRVIANPMQQCNACPACAKGQYNVCPNATIPGVGNNGGFAEYCVMKYTHIYPMPDGMTYEQGAVVEPLACAVYGMNKLDIRMDDTVVIFGPGPIGLMMVQLAKAQGAARVIMTGRRDYPLETALAAGADAVVNTADAYSPYYSVDLKERVRELTGGNMADKVIVPTSAMPALKQALEVAGNCAVIVFFGLPGPEDKIEIPALDFITSDKRVFFSWLAPLTWPEAISAISSGKVKTDKLITHRFSLEDCEAGIRFMKTGSGNKIKGIIVID